MAAKRPKNLDEMDAAASLFCTDVGWAKGLNFTPNPTDVIITPYAKCGTTWMQQIVHGLRTGGSMAFSEITEVVPWIELAHDMGLDVEGAQAAKPRAFKSHLDWDRVPKGARYIVVFRDPLDAMVSMHRFFDGWFFEPGAIPLEEFAEYYLARSNADSYWQHASSWWGQAQNPDVLMLTFEGMKNDLPGVVARVAKFIGLKPDDARLDRATYQAGFDFMKQHADQFNDHLVRETRDKACGLPEGGDVSEKVSRGRIGGGKDQLSDEIRDRFDARWIATLGRDHGLSSYADLQAAIEG